MITHLGYSQNKTMWLCTTMVKSKSDNSYRLRCYVCTVNSGIPCYMTLMWCYMTLGVLIAGGGMVHGWSWVVSGRIIQLLISIVVLYDVSVYACACVSQCECVHLYVCVHVYVCQCVYMCVRVFVYINLPSSLDHTWTHIHVART